MAPFDNFKQSAPILKDSPGQIPFPRDSFIATPSKGGGIIIYFLAPVIISPNWYFLFYATPNQSAGIALPKQSQFKFISSVEANFSSSTLFITPAYSLRFGTLTAGDIIFCQVKFVNVLTGQVQNWGYYKSHL